jgi:hypothetical protein
MKPSDIALAAFLASHISGAAAVAGLESVDDAEVPQQQLKRISLLRGADVASVVASAEDDDEMAIQARCQPLHEFECDQAHDCTWCVSKAVSSACYASSLARNRLPKGTFVCADASSSNDDDDEKNKSMGEKEKEKVVEIFDFADRGVKLTLSSAEVDKEFCDASSPLSLAGYMNGEIILL